jgi:hypothetical protein
MYAASALRLTSLLQVIDEFVNTRDSLTKVISSKSTTLNNIKRRYEESVLSVNPCLHPLLFRVGHQTRVGCTLNLLYLDISLRSRLRC